MSLIYCKLLAFSLMALMVFKWNPMNVIFFIEMQMGWHLLCYRIIIVNKSISPNTKSVLASSVKVEKE